MSMNCPICRRHSVCRTSWSKPGSEPCARRNHRGLPGAARALNRGWPQGKIAFSGLYKTLKVGIGDAHGLGVSATGKHDAVLRAQTLLDADGKIVQIPKGRHGADLAVGK